MYQFEDESGRVVKNLETGETGIHPALGKWGDYVAWVKNGGVTKPFEKDIDAIIKTEKAAVRNDLTGSSLADIVVDSNSYRAGLFDRVLYSSLLSLSAIGMMPFYELRYNGGAGKVTATPALIANILARIIDRDLGVEDLISKEEQKIEDKYIKKDIGV